MKINNDFLSSMDNRTEFEVAVDENRIANVVCNHELDIERGYYSMDIKVIDDEGDFNPKEKKEIIAIIIEKLNK